MPWGSRIGAFGVSVLVAAVCTVSGSGEQWSKQPGERVRDNFGPTGGSCRGACGMGCPAASCDLTVSYECAAPDRLRRVRAYACGTHAGCRQHDDCLDRCRLQRGQGFDCEAQCHKEAIEQYGIETATSWGMGGGPFDPQRITFEYTQDAPDQPAPVFRCPASTRLSCDAAAGRCLTATGGAADPIFDHYEARPGAMRISHFRAGRICGDGGRASRVCEQTVDLQVTGGRAWYGFEFDYEDANPSAPLQCSASGADDDFLGSVVKSAATFMPADDSTELGKAFGRMQHELGRGRSLTDVLSGVSVRPAGTPAAAPPAPGTTAGVPASVPIPAASGRLVVPMFEPGDAAPAGSTIVRDVRCTHNNLPVLEASFRLHFR